MILLSVILMDLLTGMEFDLFVPSFPALQNHFQVTPSWMAALLSVNFTGYCISLFIVGDLSDRYGRKPIILTGLITFVLGSILCLWPPTYMFLLTGRFIQGIGVAAPAILSFLIIADLYPVREQQFLMAMLNGSFNIAAGIAPIIGSYITLYFNWQGNFSVLLVMGLIVLLMTIMFVPSTEKLDYHDSVSLKGFRGYISIFKSKSLLLLMVFLLLNFVPYWIFVGMSPLLYIKDLGVSLAHFGFYQGLLAFVYAIVTILFGIIIKNIEYDEKRMLIIPVLLFITSAIFMGICMSSKNPLLITLSVLTFVIGQVIPGNILYPLCLNYLPHAKGRVSAILQGGRLILVSIMLQVTGYFYNGTFKIISILMNAFVIAAVIALIFVIRDASLMNFRKIKQVT